eukprot:7030579-Lingulodinium_polyedra.AAC.1
MRSNCIVRLVNAAQRGARRPRASHELARARCTRERVGACLNTINMLFDARLNARRHCMG